MLMKKWIGHDHGLLAESASRQAPATVDVTRVAANADHWHHGAHQARRLRRQRRLERAGKRVVGGWAVRAW